ncbi:trypsin 3A1-like [Culex pipiens pallens]|uniref:trypsin 3A1-like n=1 Tax=Culex pipiens pallens TaxID=42434 RepID=UPI00195415A6|nr:trypsin 3A1-like [Culex pipiens pallens]
MEIRAHLVVATLLIVGLNGTCGGRIIPYKAVIEYKGTAFCVGSVIDAVWILTAAQCVMNTTVSYLTIRLGSSNAWDSGALFSVKAFHVHPKYDPETSQRDIALLRLSSVAKLGPPHSVNVIPLVKPGYGMEEGTRCSIPSLPGSSSSSGAADVKAKLWSRERCQAAVPKSIQLTDDALCAKITPTNGTSHQQSTVAGGPLAVGGHKKRCNDHHQQQQLQLHLQAPLPPSRFMPGSPLVCEGKQVAVVRQRASSTTKPGHCNDDDVDHVERDLPDFFTDVAFADQWISSHVRRKRKSGGGGKPVAKIRRKLHSRNGGVTGRWVHRGAILVVVVFGCLGNL